MAPVRFQTLSCRGCNSDWTRPVGKGVPPALCPTCKAAPKVIDLRQRPIPLLASRVTDYRLAIEIASAAIRLGRYDEALAALDAAVGR